MRITPADLSGASLKEANLEGADLNSAVLERAAGRHDFGVDALESLPEIADVLTGGRDELRFVEA